MVGMFPFLSPRVEYVITPFPSEKLEKYILFELSEVQESFEVFVTYWFLNPGRISFIGIDTLHVVPYFAPGVSSAAEKLSPAPKAINHVEWPKKNSFRTKERSPFPVLKLVCLTTCDSELMVP